MLSITCPNCATKLRANDSDAGKKTTCPKCQQRLEIPAPIAYPSPTNRTILATLNDASPPAASPLTAPQPQQPSPSSAFQATPAPPLRPRDDYDDLEVVKPRRRRRRFQEEPGDYDSTNTAGMVCSILSCVFGAVAFLVCPPLFGLAGIILGVLGIILSENKVLGIIGTCLSVVGTIVGMIIGIMVFEAMHQRW